MIDYEDEYQISRDPRDNRKTSRQWKPTIVAKVISELDLAVAPTHGSFINSNRLNPEFMT